MGEVLNNGVYLPDRGERNAYDGLKGNWNTLDSIAGKVPGYDGHISDTDIHVTAADKQTWNGKADASHVHNATDVTTGVFDAARIPNLDASKITTGTIDIDRLPQGALERLVKVADQAARYALTAADVQLGDTVQQLDTGVMYVVTDETKLDSADGYTEYTAGSATSVPWSGVTGKPADYTPASHSHGNITNDGKVGTAANKPLITGTDGVVQAGAFGNQANTFCEGNDSRLSDARTPVAHTHTKSDVTDLLNSNFIPSANNSYDLGSSSYQWNNAYIKSLTINGVACGDILTHNVSEFVNVTGAQTITGVKTFASNIIIQGSKKVTCNLDNSFIELNGGTTWGKGGSIVLSGQDRSNYANSVLIVTKSDTDNFQIQYQNGSLKPVQGDNSLGTSTNKWKTLNGINPGALSLPDFSAEFDVSGQIVPPTGENQISINWGKNTFTPSVNGWLSVRIHKATFIKIYRDAKASYCFAARIESADDICVCSPVVAGVEYTIKIQATQFSSGYDHFRLSPCQGNV